MVNFNEWTVPLGRPFRALKLWFPIRAYGLDGLRTRIRSHVAWAAEACEALRTLPGITIMTGPLLSLFTFALRDDTATEALLQRINDDGRIYLPPPRHAGGLVIRAQVGSWDCTREGAMQIPAVVAALMAHP